MIEPGLYEHFKGDKCEILFVAKHSETHEEYVVYQHLSGNKMYWVRPLKMFLEHVKKDQYSGPRFRKI